ncbi:MAG: hypothetical protein ACKPBY_05955 [Dolichospermum sp.]
MMNKYLLYTSYFSVIQTGVNICIPSIAMGLRLIVIALMVGEVLP